MLSIICHIVYCKALHGSMCLCIHLRMSWYSVRCLVNFVALRCMLSTICHIVYTVKPCMILAYSNKQ